MSSKQSLSRSGKRFSEFSRKNESAFKLVGGVLVAVVGGVAWASNIRTNLLLANEKTIAATQLANEKTTAASQLANEKTTAASQLANEKSAAASLLAVKDVAIDSKDAELRKERRILDFAFHGDFEDMRTARNDALAKMAAEAAASTFRGSGGPAAPTPPPP